MSARARTVTLLVIVGFVVFLLWSTLASQHVQCSVAVEYQGKQSTATASAASEEEAVQEAQTAACGPLTNSMNDRVGCSRIPPVSRHCKTI
jgi:hypothetical protein